MNNIILLIVIILIFFLIKILNHDDFYNYIKDVPYNHGTAYRLGDVYYYGKTAKYNNIKYHEKVFPGSIACEYLKNLKKFDRQNLNLLISIINKKSIKEKPPEKDSLVIHARLGDVLCTYKSQWKNFYKIKMDYYSKKNNKKFWENILKKMNDNNLNKVYIVTGFHYKKCIEESLKFLKELEIFFKNAGKEVVLRVDKDPDEDVIWMSQSSHFATTGGGFGRIIQGIVKKKGGKVYSNA
jgi:hypothetical protein